MINVKKISLFKQKVEKVPTVSSLSSNQYVMDSFEN